METIQAWLGGKGCFLLQILLIFGDHWNRYFWDIRLKMHRFPHFNMLFQPTLTKFFKIELILCLPNVDHVINYCKSPIMAHNHLHFNYIFLSLHLKSHPPFQTVAFWARVKILKARRVINSPDCIGLYWKMILKIEKNPASLFNYSQYKGNFICVFACTIVNLATYRQFTNPAWDWITCSKKKKRKRKETKTKIEFNSGLSQFLCLHQKM